MKFVFIHHVDIPIEIRCFMSIAYRATTFSTLKGVVHELVRIFFFAFWCWSLKMMYSEYLLFYLSNKNNKTMESKNIEHVELEAHCKVSQTFFFWNIRHKLSYKLNEWEKYGKWIGKHWYCQWEDTFCVTDSCLETLLGKTIETEKNMDHQLCVHASGYHDNLVISWHGDWLSWKLVIKMCR